MCVCACVRHPLCISRLGGCIFFSLSLYSGCSRGDVSFDTKVAVHVDNAIRLSLYCLVLAMAKKKCHMDSLRKVYYMKKKYHRYEK